VEELGVSVMTGDSVSVSGGGVPVIVTQNISDED
jgi:hypothetical protein